jgi:hypothetical protein
VDIKALQLASRFALPPNSLGYCGRGTAPEKFKKCILGKGCDEVAEEIDKFIVLGPYLEMLSKVTGKEKYSHEVVEAYWLGNDELKEVKQKDYLLLLEILAKQGVPPWLIDDLKGKKPKKFIPTHLFQVLHIGVGKASGSVPYNMETINNCMIRWGEVEKVGKKNLTINLRSLKKISKRFRLTFKKLQYPYRADFMPDLEKGDTVAVHWKQVVKKLTKTETKKLDLWTKKVLKVVN